MFDITIRIFVNKQVKAFASNDFCMCIIIGVVVGGGGGECVSRGCITASRKFLHSILLFISDDVN